jgi:hypothetical protein
MRHFLAAGTVTALTIGMQKTPATGRLIALAGRSE